jgi:hypothetical protein
MKPCNLGPSGTGFLYWAGPAHSCCNMYQNFALFLWLDATPLCEYASFYLVIYQLMGIWAVSTFWLLWIVCIHVQVRGQAYISFLFGAYLDGESLGHTVTWCLNCLRSCQTVSIARFHSHQVWALQFLHILAIVHVQLLLSYCPREFDGMSHCGCDITPSA